MLLDLLLTARESAPRKLAVSDHQSALTYKQLTTLAAVLKQVVERESQCPRIGLMLPATAVFPAALFGTLWASRTCVPLNFLLNADELGKVVRDAGLDLILTIRHFSDLCGSLPARSLFLDDLPLRRRVLFATLRSLPNTPRPDPNDTAVILYTSGTTAEPKGVELTHRNLHSNCVDTIASLDIDPNQTFLNILPPFHVFGLTANVLVPIALCASVHAIPRFNPLSVVRALEHNAITVIMAIPSMYAAILKTKSTAPDVFRSIYIAISGGEPLPDSVRNGFKERFGLTLRQGYGLTETSPVVSVCSVGSFRDGTVGRPIRNVEIRIVDGGGAEQRRGDEGEILVRGPGVMKGYYKKPEDTGRVLSADGWFATGDIGKLDGDGFLHITGRAKDMLIIGGENVFPREIEAVLETHKSVLQAAVVGVPDELRGEAPVAFVLPQEGATVEESELRNHARQFLAGYKVPKRVIVRSDLPTSPTGKLLKRRLKDLL